MLQFPFIVHKEGRHVALGPVFNGLLGSYFETFDVLEFSRQSLHRLLKQARLNNAVVVKMHNYPKMVALLSHL